MNFNEERDRVIEKLAVLQFKEEQIKVLNKKMDHLRELYKTNQAQIKEFESKLETDGNLEKHLAVLQILKSREFEIADEGKSYKSERESLLQNIEERKIHYERQLQIFRGNEPANNIENNNCEIGSKFLRIAELFFSNKTCKEVFYPIVGDWREEYLIALKRGRIFDAVFISTRNYFNFIYTMIICSKLGKLIEFAMKVSDVVEFFNKFSK